VKTAIVAAVLVTLTSGIPARAACDRCEEAQSLYVSGKADDAIALLRKELKKNKGSPEARGLLAVCLLEVKKPKDAAKEVTEFLRTSPGPALIAEVRRVAAEEAIAPPKSIHFDLPPGVEPPLLLLYGGPPTYPHDRVEAGGDGTHVLVDAVVGADGVPTKVAARRTAGTNGKDLAGFYDAATAAIRSWRFFPALRNGAPVPLKITVLETFESEE
jgi:TonB family protein